MAPPERGGPDETAQHEQDDRPADQEPPETRPARKGGRHRRHQRRITPAEVAEFVKCAPAVFRIAGELGKHEAPIREWIHSAIGAAQQVADVLQGWFT